MHYNGMHDQARESMIEVEIKFILGASPPPSFISQARFQSDNTFTDTYYDDKDYSLTTQNRWLRARDSHFELKMPLHGTRNDKVAVTRFQEYTDEEKIRSILGIQRRAHLRDDIQNQGYQPFASFTTIRKIYQLEGFTVVLDETDFGYRVGEIEIMVEKKSDLSRAQKKLESFLSRHGIQQKPVRTKVAEYLKGKRYHHYRRLATAGIVT
jgi:thiamine-triphosphatase